MLIVPDKKTFSFRQSTETNNLMLFTYFPLPRLLLNNIDKGIIYLIYVFIVTLRASSEIYNIDPF